MIRWEKEREAEEDSDDSIDIYIDTTSDDHNDWSEFNDNFKYKWLKYLLYSIGACPRTLSSIQYIKRLIYK